MKDVLKIAGHVLLTILAPHVELYLNYRNDVKEDMKLCEDLQRINDKAREILESLNERDSEGKPNSKNEA